MDVMAQQRTRTELVSRGFTAELLSDKQLQQQPKTTLYRHKAVVGLDGKVSSPVGTALPNVPNEIGYLERKSRLGLFPFQPGRSCECKWCKDSAQNNIVQNKCDLCDFVASASTKAASKTSLTYHKRKAHN